MRKSVGFFLGVFLLFQAQVPAQEGSEKRMTILVGNVSPEVSRSKDLGPVADSRRLDHLYLQLKRAPEQQAALETFVEDLHNPQSANFHQWLTVEQIGERFAPSDRHIAATREWLVSQGFRVNALFPSKMTIDFSGTAGQVRETFQTELHRFRLDGKEHIANVTDPQIPTTLAPAIEGVVALHDFHLASSPKITNAGPNETFGTGRYIAPDDLAIIYNFNPLYSQGVSGNGQTIVLLEDSDMYSIGDWYAFRRVFGLTKRFPNGSFTQIHPGGVSACDDPGPTAGANREATLDTEWASAAAPNANIVLASCADGFDYGYFIAMRNLLNSNNPPKVMSLSYGGSEAAIGSTENASVYQLYLQAVAEGVSMFVSGGDWGADAYRPDRATASQRGLSVNGFASTPYNVAVGGTDFKDTYLGQTDIYWNTTNTVTWGSVKSYVPEINWDGSCANQFIANFNGFANVFGADSFCNSPSVSTTRLTGLAGGGGPSSCATGRPLTTGLVSGTCTGYPKPSWQSVLGNPADGVRDIPDVALFAAAGSWGHSYLICYSNPDNSGIPCTSNFQTSGGTSAAAPVMAAIQALVNQSTGQSWGNPNPIYYAMARTQYGTSGSPSCNASLGNAIASNCTFNDITEGDSVVICAPGSPNCYAPSGAYGVLSLSTRSFQPAYQSGVGWDFTAGIGSVNAYNFVMNWNRAAALSGQQ